MDDSGPFRFPGNLDPRAQEYFPTNPFGSVLPPPPQQVYVPFYRSAPPYSEGVGMGYPPPLAAAAPLQSPYLPPPSHTPTRALLISMVSPDVSESWVRRDLEVFGDVRAVQMERVREGIVTVHFYDLRHAQAALFDIQQQHMQQQYRLRLHYDSQNLLPPPLPPPARGLISGRAVWAQFTITASYGVADWNNQGTLVIFNLDPHVSPSHLKHIFETFGRVKELRETPMKRHQRFVEFYDVRDAAKALSEMNQKEINSRKILIQYSRPGGYGYGSSSSSRFPRITQNPNNNNPKFPTRKPWRFSQPESPVGPRCYSSSVTTWSSKKWRPSKGNPTGGSIEESMESLCINRNGFKNGSGSGSSNSCGGSSSSTSSSSSSKAINRRRTWKGVMKKQAKDDDPRFLINEDASHSKDLRTTVMIKNIPNKYSQKLLLNMLDNHCIHCNEQIAATHGGDDHHHPKSSYDFVYLPIDFINKCNVGYGFVNMTSPQATWRLYKAFHQQTWEVFNSRKICEVTYARLQGLEALKEHFKNSKFPCEAEEYMPVLFSPPRDGNTLTLPLPIVGLTSTKEEEEEEEEDLLGNDEMTEKSIHC